MVVLSNQGASRSQFWQHSRTTQARWRTLKTRIGVLCSGDYERRMELVGITGHGFSGPCRVSPSTWCVIETNP